MHFNVANFIKYMIKLLPYLKVTAIYVAASFFLGILFGGILAFMKLYRIRTLRLFGVMYTAAFRSIPPVVLLFLVYYGLPLILHTDSQQRLFYVCVTLTLLSTASISEVFRSAYSSVPKGQYEAAVSIGLSSVQALHRIMFPQALSYALPNLVTMLISLLKDGSLAFTIGLVDVFGKANSLNNTTFSRYILEIYLALTLIYWGTSWLIETVAGRLEKMVSVKKALKT